MKKSFLYVIHVWGGGHWRRKAVRVDDGSMAAGFQATADMRRITRRGKAVAVLLSEDEYARFRQGQTPGNFWDLIVKMRSDPEFEPVDWMPEEIDSWRDRRPERDFGWPE